MAEEPRCANHSFNVVNGDNPRWSDLWPQFASWFGLKVGLPSNIKLTEYMADKGELWNTIVRKHELLPTLLDELVSCPYMEHHLKPEWDLSFSMSKARRFGFPERIDSASMFIRQFENYRAQKIIP